MKSTRTNLRVGEVVSFERGLTLIELLISLVIGSIIIGGILLLLVNTKSSFDTNQNQVQMNDSGRFALHTIGEDLRIAGGFGRTNWTQQFTGMALMPTADGDCADRFYVDVQRKVYGIDGSNVAYNSPCILDTDRVPGTDILAVRYANSVAVDDVAVATGIYDQTAFVQTYLGRGVVFMGGTGAVVPDVSEDNNTRLVTNVYYVHKDTEPNDGIPSLRKISLVPGGTKPEMRDQVLVSGVENFQVQYGINDCLLVRCPPTINRYVDADNPFFGGEDWPNLAAARQVDAVRIWVLVRSENDEKDVDTSNSFVLAGVNVATPDDGIRRALYSGVYTLRNAGER